MPAFMFSNSTAWNDGRKTGVRCKAFVKNGEGHQCTIKAFPGADFCQQHLRLVNKKPYEKVQLNIKGFAHEGVADALRKCGLTVVNKNGGWPDLLVRKNSRLFAVEVKKGSDTLKPNQRRVLDALNDVLPCFVLRLDAPCGEGEITWPQLLEQLHVEPQLPEYFGA
jgi:hypothetical protein